MAASSDHVPEPQDPTRPAAVAPGPQEWLKIAEDREGGDQPLDDQLDDQLFEAQPDDGPESRAGEEATYDAYEENPRLAQIEQYAQHSLRENSGIGSLLAVATADQLSLALRYQRALDTALGPSPDLSDFGDVLPHLNLYHKMMGQVGKFVAVGHLLETEQRPIATTRGYLSGDQSEDSPI